MKKLNVKNITRSNIQSLKPYSSARDEFHGDARVFLDANENPFPSSYNRYPDPYQIELKRVISELKGVPVDYIFLGNGSDEAIDLLFRSFCEPGKDSVIIPQPTYGMYTVSANINNVAVKSCALTSDFDIDEIRIKELYDDTTRLIFLCSPNNPSGNLLSTEKVLHIIESFDGLVVIDEAYIDFTDTPGFISYLKEFENLVILQTLSKAWGLAGIRLGMCFANPAVITILNKIKPPYNINSITQTIAIDALSEATKKESWVRAIIAERDLLSQKLNELSVTEFIYPSDANFILAKVKDARSIYEKLVAKGLIVRDRSTVELCEGCLRITVGTSEENKQLIEAMQSL